MGKILNQFKKDAAIVSSENELRFLRSKVFRELSRRWSYTRLRRHNETIAGILHKAQADAIRSKWKSWAW